MILLKGGFILDINYFKAIQGTIGISSKSESEISDAKIRLQKELKSSINYKPYALRNGQRQEIVLTPKSNSKYKCEIIALPDDTLSVGDMFEIDNCHWIIVEVNTTNPIQKIGTAWLCNQLFRFQNYSSKIFEYWGVIDDGSYSNDIEGNSQIKYLNNKINIYLPYNNDTKYLYIDKRLATDKVYDKTGKCILEVYTIVGRGRPRNNDGHLLILELKSGQYNEEKDNLEEMICDFICEEYISNEITSGEILSCSIQGRNTIRSGGKSTYSITFYDANNNIDNSIVPVWSLSKENPNVHLNIVDNKAELQLSESDDLVGDIIILCCTDTGGKYNASLEIEVV